MTHSGIASFTRGRDERQHEMRNCKHADDLLPFMITGVSSQCITLMERDIETKLEEYHKTSLEMGERSSVVPLHNVPCGCGSLSLVLSLDQSI